MEEIKVPIYLITGFLESGKTSFLSFTLQQDYFQVEGKTLLILCEEGEEEYDEEALKKSNTVVEVIDSEEELTPERLAAMDILHQPERVIIEYNGMWLVSKFEEMEKPAGWGVEQHITCVDASTFQVYMANMKSLFMDMVRNADMVIFNRCQEEDPLPSYRRSIKVVNQRAEIIFEDEEGELGDLFEDEMPFDIDAPVIDILPEDYGIWFVDSMDHPDRYVGKTVHFKARALKPRGMGSKFFVPGRTAMTCCADDTTFLGYICKSAFAPKIAEGQWVEVTAKVAFEKRMEYQGEGIVLYGGEKAILMKPLSYMNLSGGPIQEMSSYFKIDPETELIVIYDDIDLEPGQLRIRKKGSAGGHNGIKDIIRRLGTEKFIRIRVGVGAKPKDWDLADFVLGHFSDSDRKLVDEGINDAAEAVEMILSEGVDAAMNKYNRKKPKN